MYKRQVLLNRFDQAGLATRTYANRLYHLRSYEEIEGLNEESNGLWQDFFLNYVREVHGRDPEVDEVFYFRLPRRGTKDGQFKQGAAQFMKEGYLDYSEHYIVPMVWNGNNWEVKKAPRGEAVNIVYALARGGHIQIPYHLRLRDCSTLDELRQALVTREGMWANLLWNYVLQINQGLSLIHI